jgi:hypothetical protein
LAIFKTCEAPFPWRTALYCFAAVSGGKVGIEVELLLVATTLEGDYSKYPEVIREVFSRIAGETCALREMWLIYHGLFMDDEILTKMMIGRLDPLLGVLQSLLEDSLFMSISRLTDKNSGYQSNLSVWTLQAAIPFANTADFDTKVRASLTAIENAASHIRKHRHKRVAHFDRAVGLKLATLPEIKFTAFKNVIELIEEYLNHFFWEFEQTTMMFHMQSAHDITGKAEIAVLKAHAYDILEKSGTIPHGEWRRQRDLLRRKDAS